MTVDGLQVHYKETGGGPRALVLLHGFGASLFSWHAVMQPLAQYGRVVAYDRPAFGLTSRPMPGEWQGENPYPAQAQAKMLLAFMDALGIRQAVLVGNSAGGAIALLAALDAPDRVSGLVLVDAAVYEAGGAPRALLPFLSMPQMRHLGTLVARTFIARGDGLIRLAWHNPTCVTAETLAGYRKPLQVENWDRALWELTASPRPLDLAKRLDEVHQPTLVITGDDDHIVAPENSLRLARELPAAQLVVLPYCGHVPHEECPAGFLEAVGRFVDTVPQ
ncbi:MAG: alpha/beta hydrolase [Chloroflexi bacterium]|nr:alpha/beta hydrolase [Chloroflexota bacterium]